MTYVTGIEVRLNKSDGTHVDFGVTTDETSWHIGGNKDVWNCVARMLGRHVIQHLEQMQSFGLNVPLPDVGDHLVRKDGGAPGHVVDADPAHGTIEVHGWYHGDVFQPTSWWSWIGGPWTRPVR